MADPRTIKSLGLDLEAARAGKTWLLLPKAFCTQGQDYPLPKAKDEIEVLASIPIPPGKLKGGLKLDQGCLYLKRARKQYDDNQRRRMSATLDVSHRRSEIEHQHKQFEVEMADARAKVQEELEKVKESATEAVANLSELFRLGRQGLDGQMRAHLDGKKWKGEQISGKAFRDCFRMVTQAVKGLGLHSTERTAAREAVMEELATSLRDTQAAIQMAAPTGDETEQ